MTNVATLRDRLNDSMRRRNLEDAFRGLTNWLLKKMSGGLSLEEFYILCDFSWFYDNFKASEMYRREPHEYGDFIRPAFHYDDPEPIKILGVRVIHVGYVVAEGTSLKLVRNGIRFDEKTHPLGKAKIC